MSCRGCELLIAAGQVDVARLVAEQLALEPVHNLASETLTAGRIATCLACENQLAGTCLKCGCYYTFRAHLNNKNCPIGQW